MSDDDSRERPPLRAATEWPGGISWIAHPDERTQRASHALQTDAGVLVVDPVDADGLDDRLAALGEVAGAVVAHDRHTRDAVRVADRHDVPVHVPEWTTLTREKLSAPAESAESVLRETEYAVHRLIDTDEWEEAVLVDETAGTMLVPETLGTLASFGDGDGDSLGLHPALDDSPSRLGDWNPDRILVGHGESVHEDASAALAAALDAA